MPFTASAPNFWMATSLCSSYFFPATFTHLYLYMSWLDFLPHCMG